MSYADWKREGRSRDGGGYAIGIGDSSVWKEGWFGRGISLGGKRICAQVFRPVDQCLCL